MSDYIDSLNAAQREAVVNYRSPSLIVAGAGSGKTRVLTCRIAYMLEQGVPPHRILALTFTNKAAAEMRERIASLVGEAKSRYIWMGTFHHIFARILRAEAEGLGYPSSFTIYDAADSKNVIKGILKEMSLSDELYKPGVIQSRISLAKNNLVTPAAYASNTSLISADRSMKIPLLADIYKAYSMRCKQNGAMDFDDLLLNMNILFRDHPDVLEKYRKRFDYILVDEYQDTNYAQYIIIRRLAEGHSNVCVVGDDAQSIYSFRGAKIENILRFRKDYPDALTFKLERNYRSTRNIVEAANSVIVKNSNRIKKDVFSEEEQGEKIKVFKAYTDQEEASLVADDIRDKVRASGGEWSDVAILYRTNMQSRVMEEALRRRGIPYKIYGGISFYQRKEIKDLLAYIRLVVNPRDNEAFRRVVNYPARGLGEVTIQRITDAAQAREISLWEAATGLTREELGIKTAAAGKLAEFTSMIRSMSLSRSEKGLYQAGLEIATGSGIIGLYKADNSPESQSALDNIEELLNSLQVFSETDIILESYDDVTGELLEGQSVEPTLDSWLQNVMLLTDMDNEKPEEKNKVTLMTIHASKGLEFRYVFIVGLEEMLFPSHMSIGSAEGLEEERRLFYVALTRAKEAAVLSFSETRFKWGSMESCRPSRFLKEIDEKYLDMAFELEPESPVMKGTGFSRPAERKEGGGVQRGGAAEKWRSPNPYKKTGQEQKPHHESVRIPRPDEGSRFKSVGVRTASSGAAQAASGTYSEGMRVEHGKFGQGTVASVEQLSSDVKVTVEFDNFGKKTLLSKFANLKVMG